MATVPGPRDADRAEVLCRSVPLNTTGGSVSSEIERACVDNELIITTWSPIHLRTKLKDLYWKEGQPSAKAMAFWEDTLRYLYLPRLKNRDVLAHAVHTGAKSRDFFGIAYGQIGDTFEGFQFGNADVQFDDTLLLIEPDAAKVYQASQSKQDEQRTQPSDTNGAESQTASQGRGDVGVSTVGTQQTRARSFHGMSRSSISYCEDAISPTRGRDHCCAFFRSQRRCEDHGGHRRRVSRRCHRPSKTSRLGERPQPWPKERRLGVKGRAAA
jgi:hypothetical protein